MLLVRNVNVRTITPKLLDVEDQNPPERCIIDLVDDVRKHLVHAVWFEEFRGIRVALLLLLL